MFNKQSLAKNQFMLQGKFKKKGYDWWWHSLTAIGPDGKEKPFFIEYFIINPKISPNEISYGQLKKQRPSYLMVKCGSWGENKKQLHRFFKISDVAIKTNEVIADDCLYSETRIKGSCNIENATPEMMCDNGSMSWDLKVSKDIAYNVGYGTSWICRKLKAFEMYWHAQGMKTYYEGTITYDGVEYKVIKDKSYGYADKNWGSNFTTPWVWLSSNNLVSDKLGKLNNSVFDIGGGKPKVFFISIPRKLLGAYYIEGKEYEMNFSKFLHPSKTSFDFKEDEEYVYWNVIQSNRHAKIVTNVKCKKENMLFVNYEDPLGNKKHNKLWNGGDGEGTLEIYKKVKGKYVLDDTIHAKNIGCEYGEFDK